MNPAIYRQYDNRWGNLPYPGRGAYLSDSGCGCLAVYHCAIELDKYKNLTVPQCRDYMVQYATVDDGTLWSGITEGLKHYGFSVHWREADTMDDIFKELKGSCNCGVILFAKKNASAYGPDGTLWTTIGHYIAFSDYKIENGQHWFYMKDSGPRNHDGWYSFEKSMKGCCRNVWICKSTNGQKRYDPKAPDPKPTPRPKVYPRNYPVVKKYLEPGDKGENVIRLQQYLDWYFNGAFYKECGGADGVYGGGTLRWVKRMQTEFFGAKEADGLVGPKTIAKMKEKGGAPTPKPVKKYKVIDVSEWQKKIDWAKVKADGVVGAIIRYSEDDYLDPYFAANMKGAKAAGLHVGAYIYSWAKTKAEAERDAVNLFNACRPYSCDLPLYIDLEKKGYEKYAGTVAQAFVNKMKSLGGFPGVYANLIWWNNYLTKVEPNARWVAQYYSKCEYSGSYGMWQYTSEGSVKGINHVVDMNWLYVDYWNKIKPTPTPTPKAYTGKYPEVRVKRSNAEVIANAIKFGKWIANNNDFHYGWGKDSHHNGCYFCGTQPSSKRTSGIKDWERTYCCNPFVHACWAHGGLVPRAISICSSYGSWDFGTGSGSYHTSSLFTKVSTSNLKPGDVLCSDSHVALHIGNGQVVQAGHSDNNVPYSSDWNSSISIGKWNGYTRAYRFNSSVDADIIIRKGEVSERVADLQRYLVWYGALPKGEEADGIYGEKTFKAVVKMQTDFFGAKEADGTVGNKTIAKMKAVRK